MKTTTLLLLAPLALAGCMTGKAEFAAMPGTGPLTQTRLDKVRGYCIMKIGDSVPLNAAGNIHDGVNYLKACFASEGIRVTGFRQ